VTHDVFCRLLTEPEKVPAATRAEIAQLAEQYRFFHWYLAFPDVFHVPSDDEKHETEQTGWSGGFDVVIGNPPWEEIRPEERKFFAGIMPEITLIENAAVRQQAIKSLEYSNPIVWSQWQVHRRIILGGTHLLHTGGFLPFSARGNLSTANLFVELSAWLLGLEGRAGMVVPSGLATNQGTSALFKHLMSECRLLSMYDFENRKGFFPSVDSRMRFSLVTHGRVSQRSSETRFGFFLHEVGQIADESRVFPLTNEDLACVNPLSHTSPVFRTSTSARLVTTIHRMHPIIAKCEEANSWNVATSSMFQMSHEADALFEDPSTLQEPLALFEGKMVSQFNHRASCIVLNRRNQARQAQSELSGSRQLANPFYSSTPHYWVKAAAVDQKLDGRWSRPWLIHFCAVTSPTNERTCIVCITPRAGAGHSLFQIYPDNSSLDCVGLVANLNSFALDFVLREKMGGINLSHFIFQQLPVIRCYRYSESSQWDSQSVLRVWIGNRVLELTYTAWDLEPFAKDCCYSGPPFCWDEERRFLLRCELDAAYFHLYDITRDDVDYIMETFPIVKRNDIKQYGDFHTKRMILDIYDRMQHAMDTGEPYQTLLDPPPADPRVAHPPRMEN
jgi:hypothetical protein